MARTRRADDFLQVGKSFGKDKLLAEDAEEINEAVRQSGILDYQYKFALLSPKSDTPIPIGRPAPFISDSLLSFVVKNEKLEEYSKDLYKTLGFGFKADASYAVDYARSYGRSELAAKTLSRLFRKEKLLPNSHIADYLNSKGGYGDPFLLQIYPDAVSTLRRRGKPYGHQTLFHEIGHFISSKSEADDTSIFHLNFLRTRDYESAVENYLLQFKAHGREEARAETFGFHALGQTKVGETYLKELETFGPRHSIIDYGYYDSSFASGIYTRNKSDLRHLQDLFDSASPEVRKRIGTVQDVTRRANIAAFASFITSVDFGKFSQHFDPLRDEIIEAEEAKISNLHKHGDVPFEDIYTFTEGISEGKRHGRFLPIVKDPLSKDFATLSGTPAAKVTTINMAPLPGMNTAVLKSAPESGKMSMGTLKRIIANRRLGEAVVKKLV